MAMDQEVRPQALRLAAWQPRHSRTVPPEEDPPHPARMRKRERSDQIMLCTHCWTGTPCRHTTTRELAPERLQQYHLCVLCCRAWAPLSSRWSWLACADCRQVNVAVGAAYGHGLMMPLGRHSFMNDVRVSFADLDPEIREAHTQQFECLSVGWQRLFKWRRQHARALQQTLLPEQFGETAFVPTGVWEEHVISGIGYSQQAWLDCIGLASYAELHEHAEALAELGLIDLPQVTADWRPGCSG